VTPAAAVSHEGGLRSGERGQARPEGTEPVDPPPGDLDRLGELLKRARRPLLLAGRGVIDAGCGDYVVALAEATGAALCTTLEGKGLFDGHPRDLGVAGGFTPQVARGLFRQADLVVAIGASLNPHTTDDGCLFGATPVVVIDRAPGGVARRTERVVLRVAGDAARVLMGLLDHLAAWPRISDGGWDDDALATWRAQQPDGASAPSRPGALDPRRALLELDAATPTGWSIVVGVGHYANIAATHLRRRKPSELHFNFDFGAVGQALPLALGIAASRTDGGVLVVIGDGGLLMHVQELETARRHQLPLAIAAFNDGAYGAEVHKLEADGLDASQAVFGPTDLASIAGGFGLASAVVDRLGLLPTLVQRYVADPRPTLWDVRIDGAVRSERYRRTLGEQKSKISDKKS
jgi:acetolactate synthase I/II/III large subunit